jgi:hypothetical protein
LPVVVVLVVVDQPLVLVVKVVVRMEITVRLLSVNLVQVVRQQLVEMAD